MTRRPFDSLRWILQVNTSTAFLLLIIAFATQTKGNSISALLVQTKAGPVEGIAVTNADGHTVNTYYGIQYAQPPVGNLRFQPPKKVSPWTDVFKAGKPPLSCYQQIPDEMQKLKELRPLFQRPWTEDCLTLNVWTPNTKPKKAPVFVFVHGGAFIMGSSTLFVDGTTLTAEGFVVVSMNYRLGVFGFLNLGVSDAPGNVGLMDQNLALHWVKDNIEAFGGDPEDITLAGMSAGSGSVSLHVLSPKSRGLYKRAIMMSGTVPSTWGMLEPEKSVAKSKLFLDNLGCSSKNTTSGLECLTRKDPEDLLEACRTKHMIADHFIPTVDGEFVVEHPSVSLSSGHFNPGEILLGSAGDEGGEFIRSEHMDIFKTEDGRISRSDFLYLVKNMRKGLSDLQVETLNVVYTDWNNPDDPLMLRDAASVMYSDFLFVCSINQFAEILSRAGNPVYRYVFDHKMDFAKMSFPEWIGANHGIDQMPILAPAQFLDAFVDTDKKVSRRFIKYIANFAKNGDPNLSQDEFPGEPHWPQYIHGHQYNLIRENSSIESGLRSRECAVWLNLIPLLEANKDC